MRIAKVSEALACFIAVLLCVESVYLPGVAPRDYESGEVVDLKVNKISSVHTQLPFNYYSLPYCRPMGGIKTYSENLGEFLQGDRLENSPYEITFFNHEVCRVLCTKELSPRQADDFKKMIEQGYHHNWIMDGLPASSILEGAEIPTGFPIGDKKKSKGPEKGPKEYYLYNHVNILVDYHSISADAHRIVGFSVEPISVRHSSSGAVNGKLATCGTERLRQTDVTDKQRVEPGKITFTYGVQWRASDLKWASRWDAYLDADEPSVDAVQWFAISNSVAIVLVLAGVVALIMYRSISNDIREYNKGATEADKDVRDACYPPS